MHSDAADVGCKGTLGYDEEAGSPGLWGGRGFWTAEDPAEIITLRELKAVRLLLQSHFADYVSQPSVTSMLLHEDNQAVVYVLNAMVSASKPMTAELRRVQEMLTALGVSIEARWLPSAENRYADALSRTWDPGVARATDRLLRSVQKEYRLDEVVFRDRPVGKTLVARKNYALTQMTDTWGEGRAHLWNPPFDFLPLVVREIQAEGGTGVLVAPHWPTQAWFARLREVGKELIVLHPTVGSPIAAKFSPDERRVGSSAGKDRVAALWAAGFRGAVLSKTGTEGATGSAKVAAELLVSHGWKAQTWANNSSQRKK